MLCVGKIVGREFRVEIWTIRAAVRGQRTAHVHIKPSDYNWYHVSRWLDSKARGQQIRQREDLRCWPSTVWPVTLCHFHAPLPSPFPSSLPPFSSDSLCNKSSRSFIRPVSGPENAHWFRKEEVRRSERREKRQRQNREATASFKGLFPNSKMQHTNFHAN